METDCGSRYEPLGGSNVGVAACSVYAAVATVLSASPAAVAIARIVMVRVTGMGPV